MPEEALSGRGAEPASGRQFWRSTLLARCPRCAEGPLFTGYLRVRAHCPACGLDYSPADSGDGPAVFVMFLVGAIVVPVALALQLGGAPVWLALSVTAPLAVALTLGLLRPFKAGLIALQYRHNAAEARLDPDDPVAPER